MSLRLVRPPVSARAARGLSLLSAAALAIVAGCAPQSGDGVFEQQAPSDPVVQQGDAVIGPQNDFDPAQLERSFALVNDGTEPMPWQFEISESWVQAKGPVSGVLQPGESVTVPVEIDVVGARDAGQESAVASVGFHAGGTLSENTVQLNSSFSGDDGWTVFEPSVDTRTIYVSSTAATIQNDGLTAGDGMPKRTIAAAQAAAAPRLPGLDAARAWRGVAGGPGQWKKSGDRRASDADLDLREHARTRARC